MAPIEGEPLLPGTESGKPRPLGGIRRRPLFCRGSVSRWGGNEDSLFAYVYHGPVTPFGPPAVSVRRYTDSAESPPVSTIRKDIDGGQ